MKAKKNFIFYCLVIIKFNKEKLKKFNFLQSLNLQLLIFFFKKFNLVPTYNYKKKLI